MKYSHQHQPNGYVSLMIVLVSAAMLFVFSAGVALQSIDAGQEILSHEFHTNAEVLIDSCVSDALLKLNESGTIPDNITFPQGSCVIDQVQNNGDEWSFQATATVQAHVTTATVSVLRSGTLTVHIWK